VISVHHQPRATVSAERVMAVFSFRYDADLVPDLLTNLKPLVDGWIAFDDRASTELFSDEPSRRKQLLAAARQAGAGWVLAVDPDERFETALADAMPALTAAEGLVAYSFALREMYTTQCYRTDGIWGKKRQARLLRLPHSWAESPSPLHSPWTGLVPEARIVDTEFNLYHLKMLTSERRQARAALYSHLDPEKRFQPIGYDYLMDDTGAQLETIGKGREFAPPHVDDGALWMPSVPELGLVADGVGRPDPP